MATKAQGPGQEQIIITAIQTDTIAVGILGTRPLILNRLAEKARHELLLPGAGRRTAADRAASLKHDPLAEFRASPDTLTDETAPTLLAMPSSAFKKAAMTAALRSPGAKKTEIAQLVWVDGERTPIYGVPQIFTTITRSGDRNRTPDVRTRAIVPRWAAMLQLSFSTPILSAQSVLNLLSAAGQISGVGDWRSEKGAGSYGQFSLVDPDDAAFREVIAHGHRAAQQAAMDDPEAYDEETSELLSWFGAELSRRGKGGMRAMREEAREAAD